MGSKWFGVTSKNKKQKKEEESISSNEPQDVAPEKEEPTLSTINVFFDADTNKYFVDKIVYKGDTLISVERDELKEKISAFLVRIQMLYYNKIFKKEI